jgi:hypothetical protein
MQPRRPSAGPAPGGETGTDLPGGGVHALGSGTGLRFVLLVVLVATSTVAMMSDNIVWRPFLGDPNNDSARCNLAAGYDPGGSIWSNAVALGGRNADALAACYEPFRTPWWVPLAVIGTVFALAAALCWVMPIWKMRRRRLRPLAPSSEAGASSWGR